MTAPYTVENNPNASVVGVNAPVKIKIIAKVITIVTMLLTSINFANFCFKQNTPYLFTSLYKIQYNEENFAFFFASSIALIAL